MINISHLFALGYGVLRGCLFSVGFETIWLRLQGTYAWGSTVYLRG